MYFYRYFLFHLAMASAVYAGGIDSFDIHAEGEGFQIVYRIQKNGKPTTVSVSDPYGFASMAALYSAWSAYRIEQKEALKEKYKNKKDYEAALKAFYAQPFGNEGLTGLIDKIWARQIESLKKKLPTCKSEARKERIQEAIQDLEKAKKQLAEKAGKITREDFDDLFSHKVTISYDYLALPLNYDIVEGDKVVESKSDFPVIDAHTTRDFEGEPRNLKGAVDTYNSIHNRDLKNFEGITYNGFSIIRLSSELSGETLRRGITPISGWDAFVGRAGREGGKRGDATPGNHQKVAPTEERSRANKSPF